MLTILGVAMIVTFTFFIMTNRMSTITALTVIPVVFAAFAGFSFEIPEMMLNGLKKVAPTAAFLLFALLFFAVMTDAGLFRPLIKVILRWAKGDPIKIAVGTSLLTLSVALDGDGVTTFLIVTTALFPLYKQAGMRIATLVTIATISFSVMSGMMPWGGPAARAMSVLNVNQSEYFAPFLFTVIGASIWVVGLAFWLGRKEKLRLASGEGFVSEQGDSDAITSGNIDDGEQPGLVRYFVNVALTVTAMAFLIFDLAPASTLFLIAFVVALLINFPTVEQQRTVLKSHSSSALMVVAVVLVGGCFTGILNETHMIDALATQIVSIVPKEWGGVVPVVIAFVSIPFSFVMSNDAYFFGVVPVLAKAAEAYGVAPVEVIRAAVLAQPVHFILPLVPSTILLLEATGLSVRAHLRYASFWSVLTCVVFILLAVVTGALSFNM
ncbi:CitMHS family transporter [Agrobacterium larrymoorei]|uniref:Citrate:proton symporter n=1 Tax=Agrobacterium larrymoorei TaxID=160699 RepID=A0AAF0HFX1_9HYPH|nr:citrate:proton symporter [Agrobacterium larrymoorei]WHA44010.1 citrate:proton symporter [Agrobacterium larrymoorei]